jgi:hypothetical protein
LLHLVMMVAGGDTDHCSLQKFKTQPTDKICNFAIVSIPIMIKQFVLSLFLFISYDCLAQEADSSKNIDSEIRKDPNSFEEDVITLQKIQIPASLAGFAGIRFVDVRADTSCIGYVKLWGINKKIVLVNGLANELNTRQQPAKAVNPAGDSLFIYVKNFWITRVIDPGEIDREERDVLKKPERRLAKSFCHITVAYFIKTAKGLYYTGKTDSVDRSRKKLFNCYTSMADDAVTIMLEQAKINASENSRYFTAAQVMESLSKPILFPVPDNMPDGIFLSYADFKAGKILKSNITLSPRIQGYRAEFNADAEQSASADYWGICYKNEFYIKHEYVVTKLYKTSNTFITLQGFVNFNEEETTYSRSRDQTGQIKALNKVTDSKYRKSDYDFVPMILNPLTGRLE